MEPITLYVLILSISLACYYAFSGAAKLSGNIVVGNAAIEIPLAYDSLPSTVQPCSSPMPAPMPLRIGSYKGLLPARAQYHLPDIRLRRIRDQDIAARYEAAKQVCIPAGVVKGSLVEALRRCRMQRAHYDQQKQCNPDVVPSALARNRETLVGETRTAARSSRSAVNLDLIKIQPSPLISRKRKRKREYEIEPRRVKLFPATDLNLRPLIGWQIRSNEEFALHYLRSRFDRSAMEWELTPLIPAIQWQQQPAIEMGALDINMEEAPEAEIQLQVTRSSQRQQEVAPAIDDDVTMEEIGYLEKQIPDLAVSRWQLLPVYTEAADSTMGDFVDEETPTITTTATTYETTPNQTHTAQEAVPGPNGPMLNPPLPPIAAEPPGAQVIDQQPPPSTPPSSAEPSIEQHDQPNQGDAVETPHPGHAGLPIHGNEDMYPSVDQRPLYRDCATAPKAKKLFLRWMEFNEKRINTLPYFSKDVDEEDWVAYRIQHALNMIEKEGWFWRHARYTREDFIRELQDSFSGSDLEDRMMRTVSKLKENEDEERLWNKYEKVMGYLRTPYEDLMESFGKSKNQ